MPGFGSRLKKWFVIFRLPKRRLKGDSSPAAGGLSKTAIQPNEQRRPVWTARERF